MEGYGKLVYLTFIEVQALVGEGKSRKESEYTRFKECRRTVNGLKCKDPSDLDALTKIQLELVDSLSTSSMTRQCTGTNRRGKDLPRKLDNSSVMFDMN